MSVSETPTRGGISAHMKAGTFVSHGCQPSASLSTSRGVSLSVTGLFSGLSFAGLESYALVDAERGQAILRSPQNCSTGSYPSGSLPQLPAADVPARTEAAGFLGAV